MKFSADDFKHLYTEMPDDELRSLDRGELNEVARQCYDAELSKRNLVAAVPSKPIHAAEQDTDSEARLDAAIEEQAVLEQEEEDLAAAAVFPSREDAKAAKALVQAAAIPAFLEDDSAAGGGFRLLVAASYVGEAREALDVEPRE